MILIEDFLDAATCAALVDELRSAESAAASTYGRGDRAREVNAGVRRTTAVIPSSDSRSLVVDRLRRAMPGVGSHFDIAVSDIEEPQFLRYRVGDFFVAHQDGNTKVLLETNVRRISTVLFLSDPETYEGGSLVFHHSFEDREPVSPRAGTLVAFRAETTHEVTPVTRGERFTVVSWYR